MPIFPGPVSHNNPNAPIIKLDEKQVQGVGIIATLSDKNTLPAALRVEGYQAYVKETDKTYIYTSDDLSDEAWVLDANWRLESFVFDQSGSASNTWVINHNLHKKPSIIIIDSDGDSVGGYNVAYNNDLKVTITFKSNGSLVAISGYAYLN